MINQLIETKKIIRNIDSFAKRSEEKKDLLDKKWQKFLKLRPLFAYIPFVDFVLAAGSLALGNVHPDSDFDVIVGVRTGRIFTVRGFCIALFWPLGLLRRRSDLKKLSSDKICFNHFVTEKSYTLSPPYNVYWQELYRNLVPVYGKEAATELFFTANKWSGRKEVFVRKEFWSPAKFNPVRAFFELALSGWAGNLVEWLAKKAQLSRIGIEKSIERGESVYKPRFRYDDEELEFHPDTRRIEEMVERGLHLK